jgi:hypothetical protein
MSLDCTDVSNWTELCGTCADSWLDTTAAALFKAVHCQVLKCVFVCHPQVCDHTVLLVFKWYFGNYTDRQSNWPVGLETVNFGWSFGIMITVTQCVQKVSVHLQKLLEVISTSIYTGLNLFNFIHKHFLQIHLWKFSVHIIFLLHQLVQWFWLNPQQIYVL